MNTSQQAWIDQADAHMTGIIRQYGWYIQYVGGDTCARPGCECSQSEEPAFAYTIGLFGLGHAELLIFGLAPTGAANVLNTLGARIRSGESLLPGVVVDHDGWPQLLPESVPNAGDIVFGANRFYDRPAEASVPVLQISHADEDGKFPGEAGCATAHLQPRPGTFSA